MRNNQPFIYDPSQQVKESFQDTAKGFDNAWAPIIKNKIDGFNLIQKAKDDAEKIKKDLNIFNRQALSEASDALQRKTVDLIKKNGRIDKNGLAEIGDEMQKIKNAEIQSKDAPEIIDQYLTIAKQNGAYINDFAGLAQNILKSGYDKELLYSGVKLSDHLEKMYSKSLNIPLLLTDRTKKIASETGGVPTPINYFNKNGDLVQGSYNKLPGTFFNQDTEQVELERNGQGAEMLKVLTKDILGEKEMKTYVENNLGAATAFAISPQDKVDNMVSDTWLGQTGLKVKVTPKFEIGYKENRAKESAQRIGAFDKEQKREDQKLEFERKRTEATVMNAHSSRMNSETNAAKYAWDKDPNNPQNQPKPSSSGRQLVLTNKGFLPIDLKIGNRDVEKIGVNPSGTYFAYPKGSQTPIRVSEEEMGRLINSLPKEKSEDVLSYIESRKGVKFINPATKKAIVPAKKANTATKTKTSGWDSSDPI